MKSRHLAAFLLVLVAPAFALDGDPRIHDPSTIVLHDGRFYSYGTGNGLPVSISDDGWTWRRAGTLMQALPGGRPGPDVVARGGNNTWAPDVIRSGDKYFVYYSAPGTQPKSAIGLLVGRTLDPNSPDYSWEDGGPVVWSDGVEDNNAIDPGVFRDPTNGSVWLTYGSYFGYIRLVQLDPRTGKRLRSDTKPVNVAINSEASIMIYRDGWYYLLVTHGSCCAGANSTYNIRMGRAKKVTGPFLDNMGVDMLQGGGKLFLGSAGRYVGPGHFGLLDLGEGVQKFSCHYEADLDRGGVSVLDIRPLLWRDGWPVAGENFKEGYVSNRIRTDRRGAGTGGAGCAGRRVAWQGWARWSRRCRPHRRDSHTKRGAGVRELAFRRDRPPHVAVYGAGAAEVDDHARHERRRLSRFSVFQDHNRRNGSSAGSNGRPRARDSPGVYGRSGATVAHRPTHRRHVSRDAEVGPELEATAGPVRRRQQHADARQIQR